MAGLGFAILSTGAVLLTLEGHTSGIDTASFAPDGKTLATSSWDKTVKLWDTTTGEPLRTLVGHKNRVFAAALGQGDLVASGCVDGTAKLWQASTGKPLFTLTGHRSAVHWLAFAPDGKTLATASWDKTVRLWDTATGKATRVLSGHTDKVLAVAFSPDGTLLASCSGKWAERGMNSDLPAPAEVIVWDLTGTSQRAHTPHHDRVLGVAFAPDGTLASAGWDGTVKLWQRVAATQPADAIPPLPPKLPDGDKKGKRPKGKGPDGAEAPPAHRLSQRVPSDAPGPHGQPGRLDPLRTGCPAVRAFRSGRTADHLAVGLSGAKARDGTGNRIRRQRRF